MINEIEHSAEFMSLRDLLMSVNENDIELAVQKVKLTDPQIISDVTHSIGKIISDAYSPELVSEDEFKVLQEIIGSKVPVDTESRFPCYSPSVLDGQSVDESLRSIYSNAGLEDANVFMNSQKLESLFSSSSDIDPAQRVLFIKNLDKLTLDVREALQRIINKGGNKLVIQFASDGEVPFGGSTKALADLENHRSDHLKLLKDQEFHESEPEELVKASYN